MVGRYGQGRDGVDHSVDVGLGDLALLDGGDAVGVEAADVAGGDAGVHRANVHRANRHD